MALIGAAAIACVALTLPPLGVRSPLLVAQRTSTTVSSSVASSEAPNGTVEVLLFSSPYTGLEWAAVGCNVSETAAWLLYENATHETTQASVEPHIRREVFTLGNRTAHAMLIRLWDEARLLLRGMRLSDLGRSGRLRSEVLAATEPARSMRLLAKTFRQEVIAQAHRVTRLNDDGQFTNERLLEAVGASSGLDLSVLAATDESQASPLQDLHEWQRLLSWFREHYPYNRGNVLGNIKATEEEGAHAALRTELQICSGAITRFPRYNDVEKILQTRQGRCGEYSQVLYKIVLALGWRCRLVVDWSDHMWVEALLPVAEGEQRWVMMDPCEAACDLPKLYEKDWGKKLTCCLALELVGHAPTIVDVTPTYVLDWQATLNARELPEREFRRQLRRTRRRMSFESGLARLRPW